MTYSHPPHRRSIRLPGYDYSQPGEYFITLVTHHREPLFGDIVDFEMRLNPLGQMVWQEWNKIPILHPEMDLGEFIVMPNHFHAIIIINDPPVGAIHELPLPNELPANDPPLPVRAVHEPPLRDDSRRRMKIPMVIGRFKMNTAKRINQIRDTPGLPVWQRNYYEHIIRSEKEYLQIEAYIENNPANWVADNENV